MDLKTSHIITLAITAAFHLHFQLLAGDWDFWVDWKDRQYWVTLTPIVAITFPAALQYVLWEKFRLPLGATLAIIRESGAAKPAAAPAVPSPSVTPSVSAAHTAADIDRIIELFGQVVVRQQQAAE